MPVGLCATCIAIAMLSSVEPPSGSLDPLPGPMFATPTKLDRIGRIVAPVMINGKGPFRMVVDTGASRTTVSPELVKLLGLETEPGKTILLNGVTGAAEVPVVVLERLQAGDFVIESADTPIVRAPIMAGADGILGVAGFTTERIIVDFKRDRIEISRSRPRERFGMQLTTVPAKRVTGGLLAIDAQVGIVRTKIIIDTGGERTLGNLALRDALLKRKRKKALDSDILKTSIYGATMDERQGEVGYAPTIKIGDMSLTDVSVVYGDFHVFKVWGLEERPTLLLGMDVLGVLDQLVIDYRRQELKIRTKS
jgi:predicted aspartyl protease